MTNAIESKASRKMAQMIENSKGKFVTVEFIKKDGTLRKLNGKMGVKGVNGGVRTTDPNQYIIIHETNGGGFKNVNKDTIVSLKCDGVTIKAG